MSVSKTERLLNLTIALLERRRGYSKEELRSLIPSYQEAPSEEAFNRLFERDKEALRDMGVPVETFSEDTFFDHDQSASRYRIDRRAYRLPELAFTAEETAVLSLASRLWQQASLGSAAARAVRRLDVRGALAESDTLIGVEPRLRTAEPAFEDMLAAVLERYPVSFGYRSGSARETSVRRVEPWGLGNRFGNWYLVGRDMDKDKERTFRLSRVTTTVKKLPGSFERPEGFTMRAALAALDPRRREQTAGLLLRPGRANVFRTGTPGERPAESGWDRVEYRFNDVEVLAEEIAAHGAQVRVVSPPELAEAVRRRLEGALAAAQEPAPAYRLPPAAAGNGAGRVKSSALDRLPRLLDLVSYVTANQGADLAETARLFQVSTAQLVKDLNLLFVCGAPGYGPDQLIEAEWESGCIFIRNAEEISQPVRLGLDEALSLVVGLQALETVPGVGRHQALATALGKLLEATGGEDGFRAVAADFDDAAAAPYVQQLQDAVLARETLTMEYLVASRDEITAREVDPLQVFAQDGHWYLSAWCHRQQGRRQFRVDRIRSLAGTGRHFAEWEGEDAGTAQSLFTPQESDEHVVLRISARLEALAEQYNAVRRTTLEDGGCVAELRLGSTALVPGLVARHGGELAVLAPAGLAAETLAWLREAAEAAGSLAAACRKGA
ncbi:helix-turn-helix transcriptional regulator [Arthrobacter mobilis]|uniref:WYL domain-containing protein n=1 Tax=Arthrobacter mobilis TaxID=2724944 RepID=A0A7X6HCG2_9MICC|nr:WYL domain-containing protein [Arthrobacter mobilis]NKX53955.1 WYL domain-containing protein [Arthrobacter mobilis]